MESSQNMGESSQNRGETPRDGHMSQAQINQDPLVTSQSREATGNTTTHPEVPQSTGNNENNSPQENRNVVTPQSRGATQNVTPTIVTVTPQNRHMVREDLGGMIINPDGTLTAT